VRGAHIRRQGFELICVFRQLRLAIARWASATGSDRDVGQFVVTAAAGVPGWTSASLVPVGGRRADRRPNPTPMCAAAPVTELVRKSGTGHPVLDADAR
jgi:hypothetical protein